VVLDVLRRIGGGADVGEREKEKRHCTNCYCYFVCSTRRQVEELERRLTDRADLGGIVAEKCNYWIRTCYGGLSADARDTILNPRDEDRNRET
jgi:hypothetical protein